MQVGVATSIGQVRNQNEDAFMHSDRVFAVCDGMGGHQAGEVASKLAISVIETYDFSAKDPVHDVIDAINKAHKVIQNKAVVPSRKGMGTTVTLALIDNKDGHYNLYLGHVGDSRAYLLRAKELKQITSDHSVVGQLVKNGSLSKDEAFNHPHRHIVTQALGIDQIEIETYSNTLSHQDQVILCTDGLTDVVNDQQIEEILNNNEPQTAADKLIKAANDNGGPDNITVIIVAV